MSSKPVALIGDGIENPANARVMVAASQMFGSDCVFRDRSGLEAAWRESGARPEEKLRFVTGQEVRDTYAPVVTCDNLDGANTIYGFRSPAGERPAVVLGNERTGISKDLQTLATQCVEIPMESRKLNCLNVAAAAAVALYYLSRGGGGKQQSSIHPHKRRPELLLIGPGDHVELGSSIRSAGAFGWGRIFVEDRESVWFGSERAVKSEGRAAARRYRNPIHVVPTTPGRHPVFSEVCVVSTRSAGTPLQRANLARGSEQAIVIPDESKVDAAEEDWRRFGATVRLVRLDLPASEFAYHYRLITAIVLAEVARQVGQRARAGGARPPRHAPLYDSAFRVILDEEGEAVFLDDLASY